MTVLFRGGVPVYRVLPATPVAGGKVRVQYNRMSGPFGKFPVPADQIITLLYGFNSWQNSDKTTMTRAPPPAAAAPAAPVTGTVGVSGGRGGAPRHTPGKSGS